jgi:hypothetical protein
MQNIDGELISSILVAPLYSILLTCYPSLMNTCEDFLVARNLVKEGKFFTTNPSENTPYLIAAWIMNA